MKDHKGAPRSAYHPHGRIASSRKGLALDPEGLLQLRHLLFQRLQTPALSLQRARCTRADGPFHPSRPDAARQMRSANILSWGTLVMSWRK